MRTIDDLAYDVTTDSDLAGYVHPHDIVDDRSLTVARRRELLAFWASDIHAVSGAPALRRHVSGVAVTIDDIMDALKALDDEYDLPPPKGSGSSRVVA